MRLWTKSLSVAMMLALSSIANAQIEWESTTVTSSPDLADTEAKAIFAFTNAADVPVEILSVRPSCGCTTTKLEQRLYQPGESGTLTAAMRVGSRTGKQTKTIRVQSRVAGGTQVNTVLTMSVDLPEYATMSPAVVVWRDPEPREPKTVMITLTDSVPMEITKVTVDGAAFTAKIEKLQKNEHKYQITIMPPAPEIGSSRSTVRIDTTVADKRGRQLSIRLFVLPEGEVQPSPRSKQSSPSAEDALSPTRDRERIRRSTPIRRAWPRRQS